MVFLSKLPKQINETVAYYLLLGFHSALGTVSTQNELNNKKINHI
jgi:hypothetical protein